MAQVRAAGPQVAVAARARRRWRRVNPLLFFILPGVLFVLALTLFPALFGIWISLTNLNLGYPDAHFIGPANYVRLFASEDFATAAGNTARFVVGVVALQTGCGLLVALVLNERLVGRQLLRSVSILPWVVPAIVVGLVFARIFNGSRLGIANYALSLLGLPQVSWLSDPTLAFVILTLVAAWRGVPFAVILLLGGLQTMPPDVYEAAVIDGASRPQRLRHVTLPLLRPIILISVVLATGGALNSLDIPLALTHGGPGNATELLSITLYNQSFFRLDIGYGAAIGTVMLLINLALIALYLLILQRREQVA